MSTVYRRRNGTFYINYMMNGRQIRHSLRTKDEETASARYAALMAYSAQRTEAPPGHHPRYEGLEWPAMIKEGEKTGEWLWALYERTRDRARNRNIPFNLNRSQLRTIALRNNGRCELTGLPFSWLKANNCQFPPYAPALDRITPMHGYNPANCRFICHAVNLALCDWGEDILERIARAFLGYRSNP